MEGAIIEEEEEMENEYIKRYDELEEKYNKFYNRETTSIKIFLIYINENNEIYNIKRDHEDLENSCITKERLLYLIKQNQYNLTNKHKLVSLLKYNIDLHHRDLNKFILDKINENYLSSLKILDTIKFNDTIPLLADLNSIFLVYSYLSANHGSHNTTKRIMITDKTKRPKTRRK